MIIESDRSNKDKLLSQKPKSPKYKSKQYKPEEISPYKTNKSPFAEVIDNSISEYLANTSFTTNPNKSCNAIAL